MPMPCARRFYRRSVVMIAGSIMFAAASSLNAEVVRSSVRAADEVTETAKLVPADGVTTGGFGVSVSVSGDTAVVGAPGDNEAATGAGAAYVYVRDTSGWTLQTKLLSATPSPADRFGTRVAISGDVILVGAPRVDDRRLDGGAAYIFRRSGGVWMQEATLSPLDNDALGFGDAVALDGDTAVIGASRTGNLAGAAYVFTRIGGGWSQEAQLAPGALDPTDEFGAGVAISSGTAIVGAPGDDDGGINAGAAYVFSRDAGQWPLQEKLLASDAAAAAAFGRSVGADGVTLIVGAPFALVGGVNAGAAYVFDQTSPARVEQAILTGSDSGQAAQFGWSVSLSGDAAIVGAVEEYVTIGGSTVPAVGGAYRFLRDGVTWMQASRLLSSDGAAADRFGASVSLDGSSAFVGAPADDDAGPASGSAYIYDFEAANEPPVCPDPVIVEMWPPDHKLRSFDLADLVDATDPDGDVVTLMLTRATQDEPVNGAGDGNTLCDVIFTGDTTLDVRRERSGLGDGRVYRVHYEASDGRGGVCEGTVEFHVPHDDAGASAFDSGGDYDALECAVQGDLNADRVVGVQDLAMLLGQWGLAQSDADLTGDGGVGADDLALLLGHWGFAAD